MKQEWFKMVLQVRSAIYLLGLVAVVVGSCVAFHNNCPPHSEDFPKTNVFLCNPQLAFWPPDMVPHPMPPESPSNDDDNWA